MIQNANDLEHGCQIMQTFLANDNEYILQVFCQAQPCNAGFTVVKAPYGRNISMLYATTWHESALLLGKDLKCVGFYHRGHNLSYNIKEPLNMLYRFTKNLVYETPLHNVVMQAIRQAVADYISQNAEKHSGLPPIGMDALITQDAENAFSLNQQVLDFSQKIQLNNWSLNERACAEYIDDPLNISNPSSQLKEIFDSCLVGKKGELTRLWYAHCMSQQLLNRLYEEAGEPAKDKKQYVNHQFGKPITINSDKINIDGHKGTWYAIAEATYDGRQIFLLEHEILGGETASLAVDIFGKVVKDDIFDDFPACLDE